MRLIEEQRRVLLRIDQEDDRNSSFQRQKPVNLTPTTPTGIFVLGSMKGINARERPRCRVKMIEGKLRPFIGERGFWDGFTALSPDGSKVSLSGGMELQMAKMLREGYWPELLDAELNRRALEARLNYDLQARIRRSHG